MDQLDFPGAMLLTHLPYWLAAVYMVLAVRRARRSLEGAVRELRQELGAQDRGERRATDPGAS